MDIAIDEAAEIINLSLEIQSARDKGRFYTEVANISPFALEWLENKGYKVNWKAGKIVIVF